MSLLLATGLKDFLSCLSLCSVSVFYTLSFFFLFVLLLSPLKNLSNSCIERKIEKEIKNRKKIERAKEGGRASGGEKEV